jgi:hypothetical protein
MRKNRLALAILLALVVGLMAMPAQWMPAEAQSKWQVEVVSGETRVVLTESDLNRMKPVSAKAAFLRTTGRIEGPALYKGVQVEEILKKVGGIGPGQAICVTARDGYAMTYSYAQVGGGILTYDGQQRALRIGGVTMYLAYESERDTADKLPRIVFMDKDKMSTTDGHFWSKSVAKIEVVPGVDDWIITLDGQEKTSFDRATFESTITCPDTPHPGVKWETTEKDGSTSVYEGLPLWVWVAMMDGGDSAAGHYRFNDSLARKGYKILVISKDGFAAELESSLIARNDEIILAYKKNGKYLSESDGPLRLVGGDLPSKKHQVKQVVEIKLQGI